MKTLFCTPKDLKAKREAFVSQNKIEFDESMEIAMGLILFQNTIGPGKITLTISHVKNQRMSLHIAEYLQTQGCKISVDEKNSKVIIRW